MRGGKREGKDDAEEECRATFTCYDFLWDWVTISDETGWDLLALDVRGGNI